MLRADFSNSASPNSLDWAPIHLLIEFKYWRRKCSASEWTSRGTPMRTMPTEFTDNAITRRTRVVWYLLRLLPGEYARYFAILSWMGGRPNTSDRFGMLRLYAHGVAYFRMFCMSPHALRNPFVAFLGMLNETFRASPRVPKYCASRGW